MEKNQEALIRRMRELSALLKEASRAYYQESREIMSNREYDALYDELQALEQETGLIFSDSPSQRVGYESVETLPKKTHIRPMLSQNKTKSVAELQAFLGNQPGLLSWKLDGLTVVLTYGQGMLQEAVTRGDGQQGALITPNARAFRNIPLRIPFQGTLILRGEALISYPDFEEINRQLPEHETQYKNPRNLCSGSVLQLNSQITAERRVGFYAFSLVEAEGLHFSYHRQALAWLRSQGFETVEFRQVLQDNLPEAVEAFREAIQDYPLPSDGLVLLMDDIAYGAALGSTARFPRDSIAFKWSDETARTLLEAIEWSASRTGLINPVAIFRPVELEGTSVSRASVHNLSTVESLALGVGDEISVYKANMIIPQIAENFSRTGPQPPPACCPVCGGPSQIRDTGEVRTLHCPNPDCPAKQIKAFELFVSRYAMNVEGLSQATLEKFLDLGIIRRFADLFRLEVKRDRIICLEGFGEKSFRNLLEAAEKARHTSLARLVVALGIGGVGPATARLLTRHFKEDPLALSQASQEALTEVEGIGEITARSIRAFFEDPGKNQSFHELLAVLDLEKDRKETGPQTLRDLNFVITGSLNHFVNRDALKACIESLGGRVSGSVSQKTTALINNDNNSVSAKNQAAKKLGIPILTEDEFLLQYQINKES